MAREPKRRRMRARSAAKRFDRRQLTAGDHELLAAFERRWAAFDRALAASNVLYHKRTCPACGLPTLDEHADDETCVVCLWEDAVGENEPTIVVPPNARSMLEARVDAAGMLAEFERTCAVVGSLEDIIRCVRDFTRRVDRGEVFVDDRDFAANLREILAPLLQGP